MKKLMFGALALSVITANAVAGEHPIGEPVYVNGMKIAAVYLQPIDMAPKGIDLAPSLADVHLEADIHAIKGNKNGFANEEWMPYLKVNYTLKNLDNGRVKTGTLMPMVADDGPHYGANVKMLGVGNYDLKLEIHNPSEQGFGRHTDKATGVGKWFSTFTTDYKFKYLKAPTAND